jgi:hypothetical protein
VTASFPKSESDVIDEKPNSLVAPIWNWLQESQWTPDSEAICLCEKTLSDTTSLCYAVAATDSVLRHPWEDIFVAPHIPEGLPTWICIREIAENAMRSSLDAVG